MQQGADIVLDPRVTMHMTTRFEVRGKLGYRAYVNTEQEARQVVRNLQEYDDGNVPSKIIKVITIEQDIT